MLRNAHGLSAVKIVCDDNGMSVRAKFGCIPFKVTIIPLPSHSLRLKLFKCLAHTFGVFCAFRAFRRHPNEIAFAVFLDAFSICSFNSFLM